ncbi:MAG: 16S rRNA (adenine(1518)-N(6)/adenine(1519)-N(6))-dimethyltransferase RsmA [Brevefilum sp.]|nr:16S rRNA (adenine(1518)-N(6)/adenine(1519)-N(6))-dimethyltransferase RsmA [Brevefilum sp.]
MALDPLHVPSLLKQYNIRPQKSLGQNFLADHNALVKIVRDAGVNQGDRVLEIGAGLGNLTRLLAQDACEVTAVEIDERLYPALAGVLRPFTNVRLVRGDILDIPLESLFSEDGYLVVANIPYYITSAVIRHLLEAAVRPKRIVLTIQREVAERIISRDDKMSLLSLSVQVYGEARIAGEISANCFYPRPQVDSSVLIIEVDEQPKLSDEGIRWMFKLAHAAFNQKRKMLRNSLKVILEEAALVAVLERAGIDPRQRPEDLPLEDWIRLAEAVIAES